MPYVLKVILFFVAWLLLQIPFGILLSGVTTRSIASVLSMACSAGAALAVTWFASKREGKSLAYYGLQINRVFWTELAWGFGLGAGLILLAGLLLFTFGGVSFAFNGAVSTWSLTYGILLFALVALAEEVLCRGYPFLVLAREAKPWIAQLVIGLLFALLHVGNPGISSASLALKGVTFLNLMLAAFLLGLACLKTQSLAFPIGIHWSWNWVQGNVLGFGVSGTDDVQGLLKPSISQWPDYLTGAQVGLEGSLFCSLVCVLTLWGLWKMTPKKALS